MNKPTIYINTSQITFATVQNDPIIHYSGHTDPPSISALLARIETYLSQHNVVMGTKRKITGIAIELLQNIYHHSPVKSEEMPSFLLVKQENEFMLIATNILHQSKTTSLKNKLTALNSYTSEKLESLYRDVLKNGSLTNEHAGLGWIDICRKSGKPVLFEFTPKGNNFALFTVNVSVQLHK